MEKPVNHYYIINSDDRLPSSSSECEILVQPHHFNKVESFKIKKIIIPYTFYPINSTNNTLTIMKNGDTNRDVTLSPGDYTITQLKAQLKILLDALAGPAQTYIITNNTFYYFYSLIYKSHPIRKTI